MPDNLGWVMLHRNILDDPIFKKPELMQLFTYCILKANHEENEFIFNQRLLKVERGSFITGLHILCKDLNQKQTAIYRRLKTLSMLGYISLNSENKFSRITVNKYEIYQSYNTLNEKQREKKEKSRRKQRETNNNDNKDNNDNNENNIILSANGKGDSGKNDFIDELIWIFKEEYKTVFNIEYVSNGKDRSAMGKLLKNYKKYNIHSEEQKCMEDFRNLFRTIVTADYGKNTFLGMITLSKLNSELNQYMQFINREREELKYGSILD